MSAIQPADVAAWHDSVGRTETVTQYLDALRFRRFLALPEERIDADPDTVPEMAHWTCFLPMTANEDSGPYGRRRCSLPSRSGGGTKATATR